MDTSLAFLGLVEARPGYGYEPKQRSDEHFGGAKPLASGQVVYAMLARFARDELVEMVGVEDGEGPSRKQYRGLPEGRKRVVEWLMTTDADASVSRTNLFANVVTALLLDEDATRILNAQRSALLNAMRQLTRAKQNATPLDVLAYDHALLRVEADIRWIDVAEARLTNVKDSLS